MYETSDIRKNLKIVIDGQPWVVVDFQFVKPGKGNAFTRTRLKNMMTGSVLERTFKTGEKLTPAHLELLRRELTPSQAAGRARAAWTRAGAAWRPPSGAGARAGRADAARPFRPAHARAG